MAGGGTLGDVLADATRGVGSSAGVPTGTGAGSLALRLRLRLRLR